MTREGVGVTFYSGRGGAILPPITRCPQLLGEVGGESPSPYCHEREREAVTSPEAVFLDELGLEVLRREGRLGGQQLGPFLLVWVWHRAHDFTISYR